MTTTIPTRSRFAGMLANAMRNGRANDQEQAARDAESFSGGVSSEVVGAGLVVAARLVRRLSDATGRPVPDLLNEVDPGRIDRTFGSEGWSTAPDGGGHTITETPRR